MNSVRKQIAIIGAGVIGTATAARLQEQFGDDVSITIFSEEFSPNTTGDIAAGLWGPYCSGDTPSDQIIKWSKHTHDFFLKLWQSGDAYEAGVCLLPVVQLTTESGGVQAPWRNIVFGCTDLDTKALEQYSKEHKRNYKSGIHFTTFTCEPTYFLPYMYKRISKAGGKLIRKRIESFDELHMFDVAINCAGLGAKVLVKDDAELIPIRGQVMRVKAPWVKEAVIDDSDDGNYIIPNINTVVLGGTHQENDYNTNVNDDDTHFIYDGCTKLIPSIKRGTVCAEKVGLRPGRNRVRLERNIFTSKNGGKPMPLIIQNYGHGGSGITLAYGCAIEVADLVESAMKLKSKL